MTGLISESQLLYVRKVAEKGMVTKVEIYSRDPAAQAAPSDDYGDNVEYNETATSRRGTVMGWLRTVPVQVAEVDQGAIVTSNTWALRVPVGTAIEAGDSVIIATEQYTVSSTDADNTLLPYITCNLRKRE